MNKYLKILHLEDLPSDAMLIEYALKKGKIAFEILVVDTKDKFTKALKDFSPDLILSDHSLPSFNYNDAWEIFQEAGLKVPFIIITGTPPEELEADAIKKKFDGFVLKDQINELPAAIQRSLEK